MVNVSLHVGSNSPIKAAAYRHQQSQLAGRLCLVFDYEYGEYDRYAGTVMVGSNGGKIKAIPNWLPAAQMAASGEIVLTSRTYSNSIKILPSPLAKAPRVQLPFKLDSSGFLVGASPTGTKLMAMGYNYPDRYLWIVNLHRINECYKVKQSRILPPRKFFGISSGRVFWNSPSNFYFTAEHREDNPDGYATCIMRYSLRSRRCRFVCWGTLVGGIGKSKLLVKDGLQFGEEIRIFSLPTQRFLRFRYPGWNAYVLPDSLAVVSTDGMVHRKLPLVWITEFDRRTLKVLWQFPAPGRLQSVDFLNNMVFPLIESSRT